MKNNQILLETAESAPIRSEYEKAPSGVSTPAAEGTPILTISNTYALASNDYLKMVCAISDLLILKFIIPSCIMYSLQTYAYACPTMSNATVTVTVTLTNIGGQAIKNMAWTTVDAISCQLLTAGMEVRGSL